MTVVRAAGLLLVVALCFWLVRDGRPERRIERGIQRGEIGGLTKVETAAFRDVLGWVSLALSPKPQTVALNQGGTADLRVLTVATTGERRFGCGPGNAVYDSTLDAVLIHAGLVKGWLQPEFGVHEVFSLRRTSLLFVLLHEIGHRELHGRTRAMYGDHSAATSGSRLEAEADAYAIDKLVAVARTPLRVDEHNGQSIAAVWGLTHGIYSLNGFRLAPGTHADGAGTDLTRFDIEAPARELQGLPSEARLDLFMLGWFSELPRAALRGDSPYSALHADAQHDSLVKRLRSMLGHYLSARAATRYDGDPNGVWVSDEEAVAAATRQLDLFGILTDATIVEITVPASVSALAWDGNSLLVMTDSGHLYRVLPEDIPMEAASRRLLRRRLSPDDALVRPAATEWATLQTEVWADTLGRIYCHTDHGIMEAAEGSWRKTTAAGLDSMSILDFTRFQSGPQWLIYTGDLMKMTEPGAEFRSSDHDVLVLANGNRITVRRALEDFLIDIQLAAGRRVSTDHVVAREDRLTMSLWVDDLLFGLIDVDPGTLRPTRLRRLKGSGHPIPRDSTAIVVNPSGGRTVLVTSRQQPAIEPNAAIRDQLVEVFELSTDGSELILRGTVSVPYSRVLSIIAEIDEPVVQGAEFIDDDRLLISGHSWSPSFVFELGDGSSRPAYFPSSSLSTSNATWSAYVPLSGGEASLASTPWGNHRVYLVPHSRAASISGRPR
jgi:hypothetical protein